MGGLVGGQANIEASRLLRKRLFGLPAWLGSSY